MSFKCSHSDDDDDDVDNVNDKDDEYDSDDDEMMMTIIFYVPVIVSYMNKEPPSISIEESISHMYTYTEAYVNAFFSSLVR